ncbi:MAG: hypothetical protein A2821_04695 [Candidatus Magasanikbacteria bacterium RIFCSPHIGHO2_01_FULL_41_23]|uniref:Pyridoxamine 5'-phosphate oxidase N-terminal domain-containing protein n=1 Tax=Candidatus Magasanikbacteria bacterium RIFCSPLOWO2_01_FULL_40_15 TaxID=1798686 RepID=A0A1F6N441_9BACT|nr:MAG: hypothetical protein A2821_04695 [Candidatus Magasanikbacteria bacterium RIFCSPHIGHO2_01_FULL_41_23]OGH74607.1 MAG: hypothetical protein A3F22_03590 [Candidatus Magasanikbacteria bacterium RIFCSPHIGHO2_12_FULL_41_16]OGH78433.1 MAG: hypothetical protein A2983_04650 [Candidatus Magasanikbacteria bacterium RIFCSPLOWO2_01_FULL_40_15]
MDKLLAFLESQRLLVIASADNEPWIANVFYGIDANFKLYFISNQETKHSQQILESPMIAFSVAWYNPSNHKDRKAVQGKGLCRIAKNNEEIETGIRLHNTNFPEFADRITVEWAKNASNLSKVWVVEPTYMKFWNDGLYGDDETKEFIFDK